MFSSSTTQLMSKDFLEKLQALLTVKSYDEGIDNELYGLLTSGEYDHNGWNFLIDKTDQDGNNILHLILLKDYHWLYALISEFSYTSFEILLAQQNKDGQAPIDILSEDARIELVSFLVEIGLLAEPSTPSTAQLPHSSIKHSKQSAADQPLTTTILKKEKEKFTLKDIEQSQDKLCGLIEGWGKSKIRFVATDALMNQLEESLTARLKERPFNMLPAHDLGQEGVKMFNSASKIYELKLHSMGDYRLCGLRLDLPDRGFIIVFFERFTHMQMEQFSPSAGLLERLAASQLAQLNCDYMQIEQQLESGISNTFTVSAIDSVSNKKAPPPLLTELLDNAEALLRYRFSGNPYDMHKKVQTFGQISHVCSITGEEYKSEASYVRTVLHAADINDKWMWSAMTFLSVYEDKIIVERALHSVHYSYDTLAIQYQKARGENAPLPQWLKSPLQRTFEQYQASTPDVQWNMLISWVESGCRTPTILNKPGFLYPTGHIEKELTLFALENGYNTFIERYAQYTDLEILSKALEHHSPSLVILISRMQASLIQPAIAIRFYNIISTRDNVESIIILLPTNVVPQMLLLAIENRHVKNVHKIVKRHKGALKQHQELCGQALNLAADKRSIELTNELLKSNILPLQTLVQVCNDRANGQVKTILQKFIKNSDAFLKTENRLASIATQDPDDKGFTALHKACKRGNLKEVELLIASDTNLDKRSDLGHTPLYAACKYKNLECAKALIKAGADVNLPYILGLAPVHIACKNGDEACLHLLINARANINRPAYLVPYTPFYIAHELKHEECEQLLIEAGADIVLPVRRTVGLGLFYTHIIVSDAAFFCKRMYPELCKQWPSLSKAIDFLIDPKVHIWTYAFSNTPWSATYGNQFSYAWTLGIGFIDTSIINPAFEDLKHSKYNSKSFVAPFIVWDFLKSIILPEGIQSIYIHNAASDRISGFNDLESTPESRTYANKIFWAVAGINFMVNCAAFAVMPATQAFIFVLGSWPHTIAMSKMAHSMSETSYLTEVKDHKLNFEMYNTYVLGSWTLMAASAGASPLIIVAGIGVIACGLADLPSLIAGNKADPYNAHIEEQDKTILGVSKAYEEAI